MSVHIAHPRVHDHGLADGCPACEEAAANPLAFLDDEMLRNLVYRLVNDSAARSLPEQNAMSAIRETFNRFGRLAKVNPAALDWLGRWGVTAPPPAEPAAPAPAAPENGAERVGTPKEEIFVVFSLGLGDPMPITTCRTAELAEKYKAGLAALPDDHPMFTADAQIEPIPLISELPPGLAP